MATLLDKVINSDNEEVYPRHVRPMQDMIDGTTPAIANFSGFPGEMRSGAWTSSYVDMLITKGWLRCDGTAVSRTTYADLFAAIGTGFGVGDGSTTFNLPLTTDKYQVGAGATAIGSLVGANTHTHAHTHTSAGHVHTHATTHTHAHSGTHTHDTDIDHNHPTMVSDEPSAFSNITDNGADQAPVAHSTHTHDVSIDPLGPETIASSAASPGVSDASAPGTTDSTTPGVTGSDSSAASNGQPASYANTTLIHI
jgi:microcystin-dependent protein